jgi:hypothetical protein
MGAPYLFGGTSNIVRFKLRSSVTGLGLTGLAYNTSGLIISTTCDVEATATTYTAAGPTIQAVSTLGTFSTPTASYCRFSQYDATNHPGLYEFQFANARFAVTNAKRLVVTVSGAASLLDGSYEIDLLQYNPYDAVRLGLTGLPPAAVGSGANSFNFDGSGNIYSDPQKWNGATINSPVQGYLPVWPGYVIRSNTAQAGGSSTITLDSGASATNSVYNGYELTIVGGTGAGQTNVVASYAGSTKVATMVNAWGTNPDNTSVFILSTPDIANVFQWLNSTVAAATAGIPDVNIKNVGNDTSASANIANTFNGTGYVAATAPAQQQQVANIAITGAALNQIASSFTQTTGSVTSGTYANTATADGVYHILADAAGTQNSYYQFNVGTYGVGTSVDFIGYLTSAVDSMKVYAYNWGNAAWDQIGTISGTTSIVVNSAEWDLTTAHTGTGGNLGLIQIRFGNTGLVSSSLGIDRLLVGYATVQQFPANFSTLIINSGTGYLKADLQAIDGTTIDDRFLRAINSITEGTVGTGSTTTSIVTSSMSPAAAVTGQFVGLVLAFDENTTTANLRGQKTVVTASTSGGVLTVNALTTAPVSSDTFTIS